MLYITISNTNYVYNIVLSIFRMNIIIMKMKYHEN